jgi:hypothetical protein
LDFESFPFQKQGQFEPEESDIMISGVFEGATLLLMVASRGGQMKYKRAFIILLLTIILIFNSGCDTAVKSAQIPINQQSPIPPTSTSAPTILTDDGIVVGANSACQDRSNFGSVTENVPANNALINNPALIRWYYFAAEGTAPNWATVCVPTSFTLYISPAPDYSTWNTYTITPTSAANLTNILMFSYFLSDPLLPHTSYRWMVVGHANGIDIGQERLALFQDESAWKETSYGTLMRGQFQTGPACTAQTISPANLIQPQDQAILDTDTPLFQWDLPNCASTAYSLRFDTDSQMDSVTFGWVTSKESFLMLQGTLQPCTVYYWQVRAGLYSAPYHMQVGNWSTASEIRSFIIRDASCPNALGVPTLSPPLLPTATNIPASTRTPTTEPTSPAIDCGDYTTQDTCEAQSEFCRWYWINDTMGACIPK